MPAISLHPEQLDVVERFRTAEFLTVSPRGVPIAWPTTTVFRPESGTFVLSTSIGLAQKAFNVRRTPAVALLFSNPTASGLNDPPQLLVQGTATCPDVIETAPGAQADLWRRIFAFQPSSRQYSKNPVTRALMDVYYLRLIVTVTPDVVGSRPAATAVTSIDPALARAAGDDAFGRAVRELRDYPSSVLSAFDSAGRPTMTRVTLRPDPTDRVLVVDVPDDFDLAAGPASLLSHRHDAKLWGLHSFLTTGELARAGESWRFAPATFVSNHGANSPAGALSTLRALRRNGRRYLDKRGLARPKVDWSAFHEVIDRS